MSRMKAVALAIVCLETWKKLSGIPQRAVTALRPVAEDRHSLCVQADSVPFEEAEGERQYEGRIVVDDVEFHKNNYVCIECRERMASEIWTTCNHQPCYCSGCASKMELCRLCDTA